MRVSLLTSTVGAQRTITSVTLDRAFSSVTNALVHAGGLIAEQIALPLPRKMSHYVDFVGMRAGRFSRVDGYRRAPPMAHSFGRRTAVCRWGRRCVFPIVAAAAQSFPNCK